jgi:hypothetical protein
MSRELNLMCITNEIDLAIAADSVGVEYIFVDLEILGKVERQGHLDTVISMHEMSDVNKIKSVLKTAKLLVRVNPINENSKTEIDLAILNGADSIMLPFFKKKEEVEKFIEIIDGRVEVILLLETKEAYYNIDQILELKSDIYAIHIGLNDLHLSFNMSFMFELFISGHIDYLVNKISASQLKYGFGGVAQLGKGDIPAELVLNEHYRLGSTMCILSRSFSSNFLGNKFDDLRYENYKEKVCELRNFWSNIDKFKLDENSALFRMLIKNKVEVNI